MEVLDIGVNIPAIIPPTIIITLVFLMMEVLECLRVMEDMDLVLNRPATLTISIMEFIVVVIKVVIMDEVDIGIKRPATITLEIMDQVCMVLEDVDIGIIPATIPTITQFGMVYCWVSLFIIIPLLKLFMVMIEVDIGIIPATQPPINQTGVSDCLVALLIHILLKKVFMVMRGMI